MRRAVRSLASRRRARVRRRRRATPRPRSRLPTATARPSPRHAARPGRLRRLLGVVVRAVPALVPVDERDAAEIRRAGLHDRRVNVDKRRADAERFLAQTPAQFTDRARRGRRDARRLRRQGHAELVPGRRQRQASSLVEQGFRDERRDALEARIRALLARSERGRCAAACVRCLLAVALRRLRDVDAAQAVGEGRSRARRRCSSTPTARREDDRAHLHRARKARAAAMASAEAAVAATEAPQRSRSRSSGRRCSPRRWRCPGILPRRRSRSRRPTRASFALRYLDYRDWQPGADRMTVREPVALRCLRRCPTRWRSKARSSTTRCPARRRCTSTRCRARRASASPTTAPPATSRSRKLFRPLFDRRRRRVFARARLHFARRLARVARCGPRRSQSHVRASASARHARPHHIRRTASQLDKRRDTLDFLVGVTQVLSRRRDRAVEPHVFDGHGYYSDPYKPLDTRPDHRRDRSRGSRATTSTSPRPTRRCGSRYRYLHDSFGDDSNMLEASWVQPLPGGFTLTPSAALLHAERGDFYHDPPFPQGFVPGQPYTADTRLSAFGAFTAGVSVGEDVRRRLDRRRRASTSTASVRAGALGGSGSPGLDAVLRALDRRRPRRRAF